MPNFRVVNNPTEIQLNSRWADATKFKSQGRIVNRAGKTLEVNHIESSYRLIGKKERSLSFWERTGRITLGSLAVIFSLGLALLSKSVRQLFTKNTVAIRFGVPFKTSINEATLGREKATSEKELQAGIAISAEMIAQIQACMEAILQHLEAPGLKHYPGRSNHHTFALEASPGLIFKMKAAKNHTVVGRDDSMEARYQSMIKGQTVCRLQQLGLLCIPHAKFFKLNFKGQEYALIAEKKLDFNPEESAQEELFEQLAPHLSETIRQLALFICLTGYSNVTWRKTPILNSNPDQKGSPRLGLFDIGEMGKIAIGLFGGQGWRGLIGCVNEEQGKIVATVAAQNNIDIRPYKQAQERRNAKLAEGRQLKAFYAARKIESGREPIPIDPQTLDFSAYPEAEKLKALSLNLVAKINTGIANESAPKSQKGRRYIYIDTHEEGPFQYMDLKLMDKKASPNSYRSDQEYYEATFLGCVVKKLADMGAIFQFHCNGHGYFIQA